MACEAGGKGEKKSYWGMAARECDSCKSSRALFFCRADSAFLCGSCDAKIHGANKLASRHERVWMCEVCEQAPASVTCKADAAALCVTCDSDIHSANPLARRHERYPVIPFYDSPDVKVMMEAPELKSGDCFFSDVDPYLDLDYVSSMDTRFHQTDSVVPEQAKTATSVAHPPPFIGRIDLDFTGSNPASYACYSSTPTLSHSVSSSEAGVVPDANAMIDITNPYGGSLNQTAQMGGLDREARVMRYREKRKNRRFEKTIRYASRKAYAETRPRIKGRFAKRTEIEAEVDQIYASSAALMVDSGYGVVPAILIRRSIK